MISQSIQKKVKHEKKHSHPLGKEKVEMWDSS